MEVMTTREAVDEIVRKLQEFDRRQLMASRPRLAEEDWTWQQRIEELNLRIVYLMADGPSQDVLDALGAHVVAMKIALAHAEDARVDSGDAA